MAAVRFKTSLFTIGSWTILRLPENASAQLPSRGLTMVEGTINDFHFQTTLEPDGQGSHWFRLDKSLQQGAKATAGDTVAVAIAPTKQWLEPTVPQDLQTALAADPPARAVWLDITPMARWDWIRWIRSTNQAETRQRRIAVARSKLKAGTRRPCCFNRTVCTEPSVSKNWVLREPG